MGIAGAAWATVLAQAITAVLYIVYLLKKKGQLRISIRLFRFNKTILMEILKIGIPVFLFQLLFGVSQGITNSAANEFGDTAIAAVGIVTRILAVGTFIIFGFVKGFQPLAGYAYGANNVIRLKQSINLTLKWTSCFAALFAMVITLFPNTIMQWFSADETVISIGSKMLFVNGVIFVFFGFQAVYSSLFLALGKAREGGILSISRSGLFFIPSILILPQFFDLDGVIYAQAIADIFTILLTALFMINLNKKIKRIQT
ncbi:MAG: MatE protein [Bacteroidetes bacterium]|nr:MAG: MatE protein [Bacteroidota bacterium]